MTTINDWNRAAARLAGMPVRVRFVEPLVAGAGGCAYIGDDGVAVAEIKPREHDAAGDTLTVETFLHEVAHLALKHTSTPPPVTGRPGFYPLAAVTDDPRRPPLEAAADALAEKWLFWGWRYQDQDAADYGSPAALLRAWCNYPNGGGK